MKISDVQLDDRRFQDLVNEARVRVARSCPEWTEHNVSDPGITLIELFAWMTEMVIYRLNRVPEKLQLTLLELLNINIAGPNAASTYIRFRLASPPSSPVLIPASSTEIGTRRAANEDPIIFAVDDDFTIVPVRPVAYVLQRGAKFDAVAVSDGVARPNGPNQKAFSNPPALGDALLLGFDESIAGLILSVDVVSSPARGAGVDPDDPPLRWEVSRAEGEWIPAELLSDSTGGFNYGAGTVEVQVPPESGPAEITGKNLTWVRCRLDSQTLSGSTSGLYSQAPEIYSITASPIGALVSASHSTRIFSEPLGLSDGTPAQTFQLSSYPVLEPEPGEYLEVQDPITEDWQRWELVEDFVSSGPRDPHFTIDAKPGTVELGPSIRQKDASWRQYGAVPPKDANVRFSTYRFGGGSQGNVAANKLNTLKSSIPGVASVTNPQPALGGVDAESHDQARQRAAMEIRTRYRAVTAADFEFLAGEASPRVARTRCIDAQDGGPVVVRILPLAQPADKELSLAEITPGEELLREVSDYLDDRRMLGTNVVVMPMRVRGVSVVVEIQVDSLADPARVKADVEHALNTYLNPIVGGNPSGMGGGWVFGRPLTQGELFGVIGAIPGVDVIKLLRIYETDLETRERAPKPIANQFVLESDELLTSVHHVVKTNYAET